MKNNKHVSYIYIIKNIYEKKNREELSKKICILEKKAAGKNDWIDVMSKEVTKIKYLKEKG